MLYYLFLLNPETIRLMEQKQSEQYEPVLGRENLRDYIRKNDGRIHYIHD
jgi:hypothetical protein